MRHFLQNFINIILDTSLIFLSYVVPKKSTTVLLGAGDGQRFRGNTKYLYLYLLKNNTDFTVQWITHNKEIFDSLKQENLPVLYKYSCKAYWAILTSQFLVMEAMTAKDILYFGQTTLGKFNFLQTWHGIGLKTSGLLAIEQGWGRKVFSKLPFLSRMFQKIKVWIARNCVFRYKMFVATSQETKEHFEKCFKSKNVAILGYPRNDVFFNRSLQYVDYKKVLELEKHTKTILYAPTFRDHQDTQFNPFPMTVLEQLNSYLATEKIIFLVKKHPYDKALVVPDCFSNIKDISQEVDDIQDLLVNIDILITDYSSISFDFLLTKKPIIYFPYDYEEYLARSRSLQYDYYEELPGPFADNFEDVLKLIQNIDSWFNNKDFQQDYQKLLDKFFEHQDGQSCQRFEQYLNEHV